LTTTAQQVPRDNICLLDCVVCDSVFGKAGERTIKSSYVQFPAIIDQLQKDREEARAEKEANPPAEAAQAAPEAAPKSEDVEMTEDEDDEKRKDREERQRRREESRGDAFQKVNDAGDDGKEVGKVKEENTDGDNVKKEGETEVSS
jgi:Skp family chaperone for outer membrane proteins